MRVWGVDDAPRRAAGVRSRSATTLRAFAASLGAALLRRQRRLRGRARGSTSRPRVLSMAMVPLRRAGAPSLRPARARLARPDALQRRHGHRLPGAHRRDRQRRAVAAAAARLTAAAVADAAPARRRSQRYLRAPRVERRLAARTLAMYARRAARWLQRRRGRRRWSCARCSRTTCARWVAQLHERRPGAAQHRARRCRPGAACTAGWGRARRVASTRSTACARRRRRSRCPRRCRSTTRWRWPAPQPTARPGARGARPLHRRAALRQRPARRRTGRARRACRRAGGRLDRRRRRQRARARQGQQAAQRAGGRARRCAALRAWLALRARSRAADEPALFVSRRGTRLDAEPGALAAASAGAAGRPADARASAHAAPLVRVAPAAVQRRPARGAGTARPRQHRDHAGLHAARLPAPGQGLRRGAPARAQAKATRP